MAALDDEDSGQNRSAAMADLLAEWCQLSGPRTLQPDHLGLATALDSARLNYHAQEVRSLAPPSQPSTVENSKPLVIHSPTSSPPPASPTKTANIGQRSKERERARERAANSQSDSGVFTSDSSKENEEKEEKKGKGKPRRIVKRKLISYRVKTRNSDTAPDQLESTDGSLDLKEKPAELPPVKTKHTLQLKERQNFRSPRTPQKLPSIHTDVKGDRRREVPVRRPGGKPVEKFAQQTDKKLDDKSSDGRPGRSGTGELISNERTKKIKEGQHSSRLRPLAKQQRKKTPEKRETPRSRLQTRRSVGRRRSREVEEEALSKTGPPGTADTLITDVRRSRSETTLTSKSLSSDKEGLSSRSASISKIPSSSRQSKDRKSRLKANVVNELTEEEPRSEADDKVLALLKLDETFIRDDFGNKLYSASSNSPRSLARTKSKISVRSSSSSKRSESSKSLRSNSSRSNDVITEVIGTIMEQKQFVNVNSLPELIRKKVRSDKERFV